MIINDILNTSEGDPFGRFWIHLINAAIILEILCYYWMIFIIIA